MILWQLDLKVLCKEYVWTLFQVIEPTLFLDLQGIYLIACNSM